MHLDEYQRTLAQENPSEMETVKMLARALRFITHMARMKGYSLEELASLDQEDK